MRKLILFLSFIGIALHAQEKPIINKKEIIRIETILASDKMQGRKIFTSGSDSASAFIEKEFDKIGLSYHQDLKNFRQEFISKRRLANNVVGVLLGKSKPDEFVIFAAHYDHLGIARVGQDRVFNGANDNASGTTAVITLAKYFKLLNNNQRSIIFVAFTGEEIGGLGSGYFSENINPRKVVAMFNIEMIGTESKWKKNSAYITGFDKSDFGLILQKNLKNTSYKFYPDPYPLKQLFYRSDNATLAAFGVPAHTISTSKMDLDPYYHSVSDEVSIIDFNNMTEIIKAIANSSQSIISGEDTPTRLKKSTH